MPKPSLQSFRDRLIDALIERAKKTPYTHLTGYMERYWLVPYTYEERVSFWRRPFAWVLQRFGIAIRIHHILRSDDARAFHDHPWWFLTLILRGGYEEVRPVMQSNLYTGDTHTWHNPGTVLFRRASDWHRLNVPAGRTTWTLFITGKYRNRWGFLMVPNFKQYWRDYTGGQ